MELSSELKSVIGELSTHGSVSTEFDETENKYQIEIIATNDDCIPIIIDIVHMAFDALPTFVIHANSKTYVEFML